jgi:hypothetical protein
MRSDSRVVKAPYEACVATYGSVKHIEKVIVTVVDKKRRLIIDHKAWSTSEYGEEASESIGAALDSLADDILDYCERSRVGTIIAIDRPLPLAELSERCPHCGGMAVRVPWQGGWTTC